MEDKRFAHVSTDPKFRNIRRGDQKVKIDKRFQSMFKDKKFKVKYSVDKRGRIVNQTSNADLRRYYHLSSEDSSSSDDEEVSNNEKEKEPKGKYVKAPESEPEEDELENKDKTDKKISDAVKKKLKNLTVDYARGESNLFSESSSDEEDSGEEVEQEDDQIEHNWGELDADADRTEEITHRLAACNMDWDRIRASDLMVLCNSFVPQGGLIKSVAIYPSEFGKERMKEEELKGPIELVESKLEDENEEENEDGSKYHMEKLRQYQLNRLKYYYAVIECDSQGTANKIYTECDGMEYESSATKIDLRFIPDDMTFDDSPKEICDKLPDLSKYQPRFFTNSALQQAKVDLTWDETNPERIEITQKLASGNVDDITETELQNYLASSSGEESAAEEEKSEAEEENGGDSIDKYRALLSEIESKEKDKENKDVQLEISWGLDLQEKTDKLIKKKKDDKLEKTPFQQYLDKRTEKRKEKREQRRKKQSEENSDSEDSDDSDIPEGIDMNDPYFAEEFDKPEFKKKPKKTKSDSEEDDEQKQAELELLLMNEDDSKKHFSLKKIQELENDSKKKKKDKNRAVKTDDFEINVGDDRFSALYTSHHFNIDPTDSHYKKTKGMEKIITEKLKRRNEEDTTNVPKKPKMGQKSSELNVLVKSVKRKAEALANKKSK